MKPFKRASKNKTRRYRVHLKIVQYRSVNVRGKSVEQAESSAVNFPFWMLDRTDRDDVYTWIEERDGPFDPELPNSIFFPAHTDEISQ